MIIDIRGSCAVSLGMLRNVQSVLLLALAMGLCLNPSAMAVRVCTLTLDTCCEHLVATTCDTDCCEEEETGCCLTVLSDEAAMVAPHVDILSSLAVADLTFVTAPAPVWDDAVAFLRDGPDPPPLSSRERLSLLEIRLI